MEAAVGTNLEQLPFLKLVCLFGCTLKRSSCLVIDIAILLRPQGGSCDGLERLGEEGWRQSLRECDKEELRGVTWFGHCCCTGYCKESLKFLENLSACDFAPLRASSLRLWTTSTAFTSFLTFASATSYLLHKNFMFHFGGKSFGLPWMLMSSFKYVDWWSLCVHSASQSSSSFLPA